MRSSGFCAHALVDAERRIRRSHRRAGPLPGRRLVRRHAAYTAAWAPAPHSGVGVRRVLRPVCRRARRGEVVLRPVDLGRPGRRRPAANRLRPTTDRGPSPWNRTQRHDAVCRPGIAPACRSRIGWTMMSSKHPSHVGDRRQRRPSGAALTSLSRIFFGLAAAAAVDCRTGGVRLRARCGTIRRARCAHGARSMPRCGTALAATARAVEIHCRRPRPRCGLGGGAPGARPMDAGASGGGAARDGRSG